MSSFFGNYFLKRILCLAPMQNNLIGKWIYVEMLSAAVKVFTFLREIFVRRALGKKASKVVDDSRGKFWWRSSAVGVLRELWIPDSVASPTLPHLPPSHISLPPSPPALPHLPHLRHTALIALAPPTIIFFPSWKESSKVWKVITVWRIGILYNVQLYTCSCIPCKLQTDLTIWDMSNHVSNGQQCQTFERERPFLVPRPTTSISLAEIILMLCQILLEKSSYILKGGEKINHEFRIWGKTVTSLRVWGGIYQSFHECGTKPSSPPPSALWPRLWL